MTAGILDSANCARPSLSGTSKKGSVPVAGNIATHPQSIGDQDSVGAAVARDALDISGLAQVSTELPWSCNFGSNRDLRVTNYSVSAVFEVLFTLLGQHGRRSCR